MSIDKLKTKFFTGAWLTDVKHYFTKINEIIDYLNGIKGEGSYKVYTALLTQSGTDDPTAIVLQNTLGGVIVWTRDSQGVYYGTLSGAFTVGKTFIPTTYFKQKQYQTPGWTYYINDLNSILIKSEQGDVAGNLIDGVIDSAPIEIRVYN